MWETWRSTLSAWTDFRSIAERDQRLRRQGAGLEPDRRARQGERRRRERGHGDGVHARGRQGVRMALYWDVDSARREAETRD